MQKDPVDMLERSHRRLEEAMAELVRALTALASGAGGAAEGDVVAESMAFLLRSGRHHVGDEEESIFPRLGGGASALVARLTKEHREQEALLAALDEHTREAHAVPATLARDALRIAERLEVMYREHTALEDDELLPLVGELDESSRRAAGEEMQARRGKGGAAQAGGGGSGGGGGGGGGGKGGKGGGGGGGGGGGKRR